MALLRDVENFNRETLPISSTTTPAIISLRFNETVTVMCSEISLACWVDSEDSTGTEYTEAEMQALAVAKFTALSDCALFQADIRYEMRVNHLQYLAIKRESGAAVALGLSYVIGN